MMSTESANSFTLIGEASDGGTMENLSRRLKVIGSPFLKTETAETGGRCLMRVFLAQVTSDLFDIMSGQTDVDHPLCEECTDTLLDHLDTQLNITENECQNYKQVHFGFASLPALTREITHTHTHLMSPVYSKS